MADLTYLPCAIEHLKLIKPQPGSDVDKAHFLNPGFEYMVRDHFAISGWLGPKCLMAAGIVGLYKHRAVAWALVGADAGPYLRQLTNKVRDALDISPYQRIEMLVDYQFDAGHRWAKMLGFEVEAEKMRMSGFYGNDETMYVRIK